MRTLTGAELVEALHEARIPARYHRPECSLQNFGKPGEALLEWVKRSAPADARVGIGKFLHGNSQSAIDTFYTLARSLTLVAMSVKVYSLPMLARSLGTPEFAAQIEDVGVLFIAGFYEAKHTGAFTPAQLNEFEWFFRSRWNSNLAIVFLSSSPINECEWYSISFLDSMRQFVSDEIPV